MSTNPAFALSCTAKEDELVAKMYKIYVKSGIMPSPVIENHYVVGTGVNVNGTIKGLVNYESCWKETPPCDRPGEYQDANINFVTSANEVQRVYDSDPRNALLECFRKIGIVSQKNSPANSFLPW